MNQDNQWHLDKKVPISLIVAIVLQTMAFVWLLANMNSKIDSTIRRTEILEVRSTKRASASQQNTVSIAVINENLKGVRQSLERIEKAVEKRNAESR